MAGFIKFLDYVALYFTPSGYIIRGGVRNESKLLRLVRPLTTVTKLLRTGKIRVILVETIYTFVKTSS